MAPLALLTNFPTRLSHLHCYIALDCPIGIISLVLSLYLHQLESHHLSFKKVYLVSEFETTGPIDRTPETPGSEKNYVRLSPISNSAAELRGGARVKKMIRHSFGT